MNEEQTWKEFEEWRDESPNQCYGLPVWDAWQAACANRQKEIDSWKIVAENWRVKAVEWSRKNAALEAQLREQHQNQLDLMEKLPVEPKEIYSPNTVVIG